MQPFSPGIFVPIALLVSQTALLLLLCWFLFRKIKLIRYPIAGMENGEALVSAALILGVLLLSGADAAGLLRSYRTFASLGDDMYYNTLVQFSRTFLVVLLGVLVYGALCAVAINSIGGQRFVFTQLREGNLPLGILLAGIVLGLAVCVSVIVGECIDWMTPVYIDFR